MFSGLPSSGVVLPGSVCCRVYWFLAWCFRVLLFRLQRLQGFRFLLLSGLVFSGLLLSVGFAVIGFRGFRVCVLAFDVVGFAFSGFLVCRLQGCRY